MPETPPTVYVFYDYVCPYAYIGKKRADELEREYDIKLEWLPWEIHPSAEPQGEVIDYEPPEANRTYLESLANEVDTDLNGPETSVNSNLALRGALYAKDQGNDTFRAYHEAAFEAVWTEARNLGHENVLQDVAKQAGLDPDTFLEQTRHHSYQYRLDRIDDSAENEAGIQRVPTFVFGDQRIVGNDRFDASLKRPLEAFLERRKHLGEDGTTTLEWDLGLDTLG